MFSRRFPESAVIVRPRVLELRVIIIYRKYAMFIPDAVMRIPRYTRTKDMQVYSTGPDDVINYTKIYGMFGCKQYRLFSKRTFRLP